MRSLVAFGVLLGWTLVACSSASNPLVPDGSVPDAGGTTDAGKHGKDGGRPVPDSASDTGSRPDVGNPHDAGPTPYPPGPYGVAVGDVMPDLHWIGYRDDKANEVATIEPYAPYSLNDARLSGHRYAMVNLAESECPGCQKSAGQLAEGGAGVVQAGGVVIEVLETTGFVSQATKADLDAWIDKYMLTITSVKDLDDAGTATFNTLGMREQAYIVDLTTMKILQVIEGDTSGIGATSGGKGLAAMHVLLGK